MSSSGDIRRSKRRLHSDRWTGSLRRRARSDLSFLLDMGVPPKLMLDTTVYIDELQNRLPLQVEALVWKGAWHSTVSECELAIIVGLLDPQHPKSAQAIEVVMDSIERRPAGRIVTPDRDTWREAGMLAGLMSRLQQYGKADQRRTLNDALILLSAAKAGLTVLTRNIADFDLLMQLAPHTQAVFYEV